MRPGSGRRQLAWVHSASAGKHVLVTVHAKRGTEGMNAAGVLPSFTGIAVHDAWAPYDTYDGVAGDGLCVARPPGTGRGHRERNGPGRHLGTAGHRRPPGPQNAARAAREAGQAAVSRKDRVTHGTYFTDAAKAGIALNAARRTKLQKNATPWPPGC